MLYSGLPYFLGFTLGRTINASVINPMPYANNWVHTATTLNPATTVFCSLVAASENTINEYKAKPEACKIDKVGLMNGIMGNSNTANVKAAGKRCTNFICPL